MPSTGSAPSGTGGCQNHYAGCRCTGLGVQSPIKNQIGNVFVPVSDMDSAVEWYTSLFGVPAGEPSHDDTIFDVEMAGDTNLTLDANKPVENSSQPLCYFWTDDVAATHEFLQDRGDPIVMGPMDVGSVIFLTFEDPDGNLLMACESNE